MVIVIVNIFIGVNCYTGNHDSPICNPTEDQRFVGWRGRRQSVHRGRRDWDHLVVAEGDIETQAIQAARMSI